MELKLTPGAIAGIAGTALTIGVGVALWVDDKFQEHEMHLTESEATIIQAMDEHEEVLIQRMLTSAIISMSGSQEERLALLERLLLEERDRASE